MRAIIETDVTSAAQPASPAAASEWETDLFLTSVVGAILLAIFLIFGQ
jgi:hypothetical protein